MSDDGKPRFRTPQAKTPVRGVSLWTDDRRAEVGADHRRQERARSSPEIRPPEPAADTVGVVEDMLAAYDLTSPSPLVEGDNALMEVWRHIDRSIAKLDDRRRTTANHVLELKASQGSEAIDKLRQEVDALKRFDRWIIGGILTALMAAGGSLVAVGRGLYDRGAHEGADGVRLEHVERAIDRLRDDLRDIADHPGRHSSLLPSASSDSALLTEIKGTAP